MNNGEAEEMPKAYGPLMSGPNLYRALGFRTHAAFARAARAGMLGVEVFTIKGRGRSCIDRSPSSTLSKTEAKAIDLGRDIPFMVERPDQEFTPIEQVGIMRLNDLRLHP